MNQNYSTYRQTDVNTSSPTKIILMLYDGATNFLKKSIEYAEQGDIKNKNIYANKARDIIVELNNSLDIKAGGEIAMNLRRLYLFMNRHLMQASWNNNIKGIKEVIKLLSNLREAWQEIHDKNTGIDDDDQPRQAGMEIRA
ncbi:MAG: flagellar export chaperone FliS [Proteobacteria bacterium]|nr:flagellar export chaperone FliS [Pseudomonadota bacterium]